MYFFIQFSIGGVECNKQAWNSNLQWNFLFKIKEKKNNDKKKWDSLKRSRVRDTKHSLRGWMIQRHKVPNGNHHSSFSITWKRQQTMASPTPDWNFDVSLPHSLARSPAWPTFQYKPFHSRSTVALMETCTTTTSAAVLRDHPTSLTCLLLFPPEATTMACINIAFPWESSFASLICYHYSTLGTHGLRGSNNNFSYSAKE